MQCSYYVAVFCGRCLGFLGLLVCLMHLAARVIERFPGEPEEVATSAPLPVDVSGDDAQIAVVLAVVAAQRGEG